MKKYLDENGLAVVADHVNGKEPLIFKGTSAEWNALTEEEKAVYALVGFPDVAEGGAVVVDEVTEGNLNPVTSNAVANAIGNWVLKSGTSSSIQAETDTSIAVYPSQGKKIIAVGACGFVPNNTWSTFPHLDRASIINNGAYVNMQIRTLVQGGQAGTSQAYQWNCWVLEVDE